jgi:hypothetical protein
MKHKLLALVVVTAVFILTTGCINRLNVGPVQTDEETVEAGDIDSARVNIQMGVGKLDINGGAAGLLDAKFTYNVEEWKPEVNYEISSNEGRLTVRQPEGETGSVGIPDTDNVKNEWDLKLDIIGNKEKIGTIPGHVDL